MIEREYTVASEWVKARRWEKNFLKKRGTKYVPCIEHINIHYFNEENRAQMDASISFRVLGKDEPPVAEFSVFEDGFRALCELGQPFLNELASLDSETLGREATVEEFCAMLDKLGFVKQIPEPIEPIVKKGGRSTKKASFTDVDGQTAEEFADQLFEFEVCAECEKDKEGHTYGLLLGHWFAKCKEG